jgi:hypothetical protein
VESGEWLLFVPLKVEPIGCPETSVSNYRDSLRNNPEEQSSYGPRLFESGVLRGISRSRKAEVTAEWGKLHIEELHDVYFSRCVVG